MKHVRKLIAKPIIRACIFLYVSTSYSYSSLAAKVSKKENVFSAGVSIASEYDSNLVISELDSSSSSGDTALTLDFDMAFDTALAKHTDLSFGYNFFDSRYNDFSEFNLQSHFASANFSHDLGDKKMGLAFRHIDTRLDGENFLTLRQISPSFSKLVGKKYYVRVDYAHTDKRFDGRPNRDTTTQSTSADLYWFIKGNSRYAVVGYKLGVDDSASAEFDYKAHNLKIRFVQRISIASRDVKFNVGWRYERRNYDAITPSIGEVRDDKRQRFESTLEVPLVAKLYVKLRYEYADFKSNLPAVDFDRQFISMQLGTTF